MIPAGPATRVFVALEPVDMRKGYDGLYGLVTHQLGEDPRSGHLFVFTNSQRNRLKILVLRCFRWKAEVKKGYDTRKAIS